MGSVQKALGSFVSVDLQGNVSNDSFKANETKKNCKIPSNRESDMVSRVTEDGN